jgi:hypothetical protein
VRLQGESAPFQLLLSHFALACTSAERPLGFGALLGDFSRAHTVIHMIKKPLSVFYFLLLPHPSVTLAS